MSQPTEKPLQSKKVLLLGASGLVGSHVLKRLLQMDEVRKVKVLSRNPLDFKHLKLEQKLIDFDHLMDFAEEFKADALVSCLGTTLKKAGSREAFYQLEYEVVRKIARLASMNGATEFLLVSSLGASKDSASFYLRTKGQIETELMQYPFMKLRIYRPSFLLGERNESRPLEELGKLAFSGLSPLMWGPLRRLKPVKASQLAERICTDLTTREVGKQIIHNEEI